ncbi:MULTISPECIES: hypothetical protein [Bradyrhizobium]|uniref:hypothetical protein n=1 Tax=Bradyrhizobium TaxID=374 RepID=UPI0035E0B556
MAVQPQSFHTLAKLIYWREHLGVVDACERLTLSPDVSCSGPRERYVPANTAYMTVRNLSPSTQQPYIYAIAKFSRHFGYAPDRLSFEQVRAYPRRPEAIRRLVHVGPANGRRPPRAKGNANARQRHGRRRNRQICRRCRNSGELAKRKRQLVKGPEEFQKVRRDRNRK